MNSNCLQRLVRTIVAATLSIVSVMFISSCSDGTSPTSHESLRKGLPTSLLGTNSSDTIHAFLRYDYCDDVEPDGMLDPNAAIQAFLADDNGFVNATSVSANSQLLKNMFLGKVFTGQYDLDGPNVGTTDNPSVDWSITGYLGSSLTTTFSLAPRFSFSASKFIDTVSKSGGLWRTYSNGINAADSVDIAMVFDNLFTTEYIHPDSATGGGYVVKFVSDDGSIGLSSAEIAHLTPYRMYYLKFGRARDSVMSYQGRKVLLSSRYTTGSLIYLIP